MVEDRSGNYWFALVADNFGGAGGVSRFDGVRWSHYTTSDGLASNNVTSMLEDRSGSLWLGTDGGVTRFDGVSWKTFTTADGLASNHIGSMLEDRSGSLWLGTDGGVTRYDGVSWKTYTTADGLAGNGIGPMLEDHSGNLWFGTGGGVTRFDGVSWKTYTTADGLPSNSVTSMVEDGSGNLWFGSFNTGVARYDGVTWKTFTTADGLPDNYAFRLLEDHSGNLWIGTLYGVSRFDGVKWRIYDRTVNFVNSMFEDRLGNIWVGIYIAGVTRYDGVSLNTYTTSDGLLDNSVSSILEDRSGNLWFGTYGGVSRFDGVSWKNYTTTDGLGGGLVASELQDRSGNFWFGLSAGGVSRYDGVTWRTYTTADGLAGNYVTSIAEDRFGNLWFGTDAGVSLFDGSTWGTYTDADGLADNNVNSIVCDRAGNLWFATTSGVTRFDEIGTWKTYTTADGLASNVVERVLEDSSGNLWFATEGGVSRYDGVNWKSYTPANGAPSNTFSMVEDRSGSLWFGTFTNGLIRFDGESWKAYTTVDGLPGALVGSMLKDHLGSLWFGTSLDGVTRYEQDRVPPKTVFLNAPVPISGSRDLSASFIAAFGEARGIEYSYRFDGGAWSGWAPTGAWTGNGLPDGPHVLEARSRDYAGNVDPFPALASFFVDATPPSPSLSSPVFGQPVRGVTAIRGTTSDPRFMIDSVMVRPTGATSWTQPAATLLSYSSVQVTDGTLAGWDTSSLPDGGYDLRLAVTDSLGLTGTALVSVIVDNHAPFSDVTTPAKVAAATGGDVFTTNAETHLYFPPHAFAQDALVTIAPAAAAAVPASLPSGAVKVLGGYEIGWAGALQKPARLTLSYSGIVLPAGVLAMYRSTDGSTWERLGGTVDPGNKSLSLAISLPGRYALFADNGIGTGQPSLSGLAFTPRVFSPAGGFADQRVGISFRLGRAAPVTVKVFSRSGRLIREVIKGEELGAGDNMVRWDGRDRNGGMVVDGMYLVSVEALGRTETEPLAVVR